jgi:hypothetical protein
MVILKPKLAKRIKNFCGVEMKIVNPALQAHLLFSKKLPFYNDSG